MDIKQKIADEFSKYAESYNKNAILQKNVAIKLAEKIKKNISDNHNILDVGAGTGFVAELLSGVDIIQSDISFEMCNINKKFGKSVVADFDFLPFYNNYFDFIISSLALQWSLDLRKTFAGIYKILKFNGHFAFAIFGEKTLQELRFCSNEIGVVTNNNFYSSNQIKEFLEENNFKIISEEKQHNIENYKTLLSMLNSMKSIGAGVNLDENKKNLSKSQIKKIEEIYLKNYQNNIQTSWEIYYFIAQKN